MQVLYSYNNNFPKKFAFRPFSIYCPHIQTCPGGEMVDTTVLEAVALRCESSSLSPGTKKI